MVLKLARRTSLMLAAQAITVVSFFHLPAGAQGSFVQGNQNSDHAAQSAVPLTSAIPSTAAAQKSVPSGNKQVEKFPAASTAGMGDTSLLKRGAGDLIEVNVYNVPELSTKARIGNSGDIYLPLVDYVSCGRVDGRRSANPAGKAA
ncbi:MAG TPA: polysaccharide biosynthesis/export family protein [Candidatus Sulfotelmatobacter sp.]